MALTHLHCFGSVSLSAGEAVIRNFGTTRAAKLLVLLCLSRSGRMPRTQLAEQLWPDDFYDSTRLRLRQEIHRLKRVLEAHSDLIGSDQNDVWIDKSAIQTDVDILEAFAKGRFEPDADLNVSGEFLPGWDDPWAVAERSRAQQLHISAVVSFGTKRIESGDASGALAVAKSLVAHHPLNEELRMVAVNAHASLGSVAAAVAEYQDLRRQMREQLGVEPTALNEDFIAGLAGGSPTPRVIHALAPVSDWSSTVPFPLDDIVGREELLDEVLSRLNHPAVRIVTLVGPGGVGKTRLATEVARNLIESGKGRVAFATLGDVADPAQWARAVLSQFREDPPAESVPLTFLANLLREQPTTLVLDNMETVLPLASDGLRELISATPGLQILVTSVTPTKAPGEQLIPVGPLDPSTSGRDVLASALQAVRPLTVGQPGVMEDLLEISKRLDGYPLALRLAAARLRLLSPRALLDQLETSLSSAARGDLPERHRSLQAALFTSFSMLTLEQQVTLGRIAAFPGGLSMDMAAIHFEGEPYLDHLETLLDSALVRLQDQVEPIRIRLLSPVRQYVWGQLSGDQRTNFAAQAAESTWKYLNSFGIAPWKAFTPRALAALDTETDNLAFAWKWAFEHNISRAFEMCPAFSRYEIARGRPAALLAQLTDLKSRGQSESTRVGAEFDLAHVFLLHACSREKETVELLAKVRKVAEELGDKHLLAQVGLPIAMHSFRHDFANAMDVGSECLKWAEAVNDSYVVARVHRILANVANFENRPDATLHHVLESYNRLLALDAGTEVATVGAYLASHLWHQGRPEESAQIIERAWEILEITREPGARAYVSEQEGRIFIEEGRFEEAEALLREALRLWTLIGSSFQQADQNHSITRTLVEQGRFQEARATICAAADFWYEDHNEGGICCSLVLAAIILKSTGEVEAAKRLIAFALQFEKDRKLVLVSGELMLRAKIIAELGDVGTNTLEPTLDVAHSLFAPLR